MHLLCNLVPRVPEINDKFTEQLHWLGSLEKSGHSLELGTAVRLHLLVENLDEVGETPITCILARLHEKVVARFEKKFYDEVVDPTMKESNV